MKCAGYNQLVDNMAYHLAFLMFDESMTVFEKKVDPHWGPIIKQLDKIAAVGAKTYGTDIELLMEEVMEEVDERLAALHLHDAMFGELE